MGFQPVVVGFQPVRRYNFQVPSTAMSASNSANGVTSPSPPANTQSYDADISKGESPVHSVATSCKVCNTVADGIDFVHSPSQECLSPKGLTAEALKAHDAAMMMMAQPVVPLVRVKTGSAATTTVSESPSGILSTGHTKGHVQEWSHIARTMSPDQLGVSVGTRHRKRLLLHYTDGGGVRAKKSEKAEGSAEPAPAGSLSMLSTTDKGFSTGLEEEASEHPGFFSVMRGGGT